LFYFQFQPFLCLQESIFFSFTTIVLHLTIILIISILLMVWFYFFDHKVTNSIVEDFKKLSMEEINQKQKTLFDEICETYEEEHGGLMVNF
jgi:hypothetical protein